MKKLSVRALVLIAPAICITACSAIKHKTGDNPMAYKPDSLELYDLIVRLDSVFFQAYNNCDLNRQAEFYSDSLEFYHDYSGLTTSKKDVLEATKRNICGKVSRELVPGSIEVYPLRGFGAIEIGLHKFHNNTEKNSAGSRPGKFIIIWQQKGDTWKISRVVSLH